MRKRDKISDEKKAIEEVTAHAFLELYNKEMGTSFFIIEISENPDIRCQDREGNKLNLEITLTEDNPKDIQALLGRSNHKSPERLKNHLANVEAGKENILDRVSCLQRNVLDMIIERIQKKFDKDYGHNVALVIRDTSGVGWDWNLVGDDIKNRLNLSRNPFDKGIPVAS